MKNAQEQQKLWAKIVAKAWADDGFKQQLLADPLAVLNAEGANIADGVEFKCVESTEKQVWLVLPPKPSVEMIAEGEERLAADVFPCCN